MGRLKKTSKKIHRWQIRVGKDAQYQMSLESCILKQKLNTIAHLLEWPKSRMLTINPGENVEQ